MMSKIWTKWERNPTVTTVATTNYPVAGLVFPAVTSKQTCPHPYRFSSVTNNL